MQIFVNHPLNHGVIKGVHNKLIGQITHAVAQSVERATPGQEVVSSIPTPGARSLLVGPVSV